MPEDAMRPGYAHLPDGVMHFVEQGRGEPVLLLHANPRSHRYFRHALPRLADRYRAIAVDTPGFGNSSAPPPGARMADVAGRFVAFLDALGLERAHLVGLHTGNKLAAAIAEGWPDRVGRLVLCGQTHSMLLERAARDAAIRKLVDHYFPRYEPSADGSHRVRAWAAAWAEMSALAWPAGLRTGATVSEAQLETVRARVVDYAQAWQAIVPAYEANFDFDLEASLRAVRAPTLVLELVTQEEAHLGLAGERIRAVMADARWQTVAADGEVFEVDPDRVMPSIRAFLELTQAG